MLLSRSMKIYLSDPFVWAFLAIALVWLRRTFITFRTLHSVPVIRPSSASEDIADCPLVSVIVPARNEENNIRQCIVSLLEQDYPRMEIVIANDNSVDGTGDIIRSFGERVVCFNAPPTPPGWTGKNAALHAAVDKASGEWFLFTDADTRHERTSVSSAFRHALRHNLDFLTLTPRCLVDSLAEKMIQPGAMGYMGLWFPIDRINDPRNSLCFANGQYLFMKRSAYQLMGGHAAVRGEMLEDFAFMKKAKQHSVPFQCVLGVPVYGTRMYDTFSAIWRGWRRIYLHAFARDWASLLQKSISVFLFSFLPFVLYVSVLARYAVNPSGFHAVIVGTATITLMMVICTTVCAMMKVKLRYVIYHPVAALALTLILLDAFRMAVTNGKTHWR